MYKITSLDDKARWNHIKQARKFYAVLEYGPLINHHFCAWMRSRVSNRMSDEKETHRLIVVFFPSFYVKQEQRRFNIFYFLFNLKYPVSFTCLAHMGGSFREISYARDPYQIASLHLNNCFKKLILETTI